MRNPVAPRFSIVMPTFNRAYVVWKAINSVLDQTHNDWELIVVDDGSTDDTQRLLQEFSDRRIHTLITTNRGPSAARNVGIKRSTGELVAYLDSDNTWDAEFLATFDAEARERPDNVVWYCGQETTIYSESEDGIRTLQRETSDNRSQYTLDEIWNLGSPDTSALVHRRSAAQVVGGWDENCKWLEDWDMFLRICLEHPGRWHQIPRTLLVYRQIHGPGADGLCANALQEPEVDHANRQYLINKWKDTWPSITDTLDRTPRHPT